MSQSNLLFSSSPHVHGGDSVPKIMRAVVLALAPASAFSIMTFGFPALLVILLTVASCLVTEQIFQQIRKRPSTIDDWSAALTGLLLALTLPPHSPWWICVVGGVFAIAVGKQLYGGLGFNMFNPALISRVFLLISFPVELTTWPVPGSLFGPEAFSMGQAFAIIFGGDYGALSMDAITAATPLGEYKTGLGMGQTLSQIFSGDAAFDYIDAGGGMLGGSLGETSALLLAAGGVYLLLQRVITWHIPLTTFAGCLIPATLFWLIDPDVYPDPVFHALTGGLVIGAFFMATDMVTSPVTPKGQIIFGLGCGFLTFVIRTWGAYPEGVSFAVVLMNGAVPLIDQYTRPVVYGKPKKKQA